MSLTEAQLEILRRICDRGIDYGLNIDDTFVVDTFQHMKDELERLRMLVDEDAW